MSDRFLRLAEVQKLVPYSRSSLYLKISRGEFPKPINLGARAVAWLERDVAEWMEARIKKSGGSALIAPAVPTAEGKAVQA